MPIHLHRSNRVERLVEALGREVARRIPLDPFERVPVVVGSRGMERYLRHELATRLGVASALAFPFPRDALRGAAAWWLAGAPPGEPFWERGAAPSGASFDPGQLVFGVIPRLRARAAEPAFAHVTRYLALEGAAEAGRPVGPRELLFAQQVAAALDRSMHDRPWDALAWARDPAGAARWEWLARLLADLGVATDDNSPPRVLERLRQRQSAVATAGAGPAGAPAALHVFGLSTLGPGDRAGLAALAPALDLHLYLLAPTQEWIVDSRSRDEYRRAVRAARAPGDLERVELEQRHANPLLAGLAAPSRDVQSWLEETGYVGDDTPFDDPAPAPAEARLLARLQSWVLSASSVPDAGAPWGLDDSLAFHSTYGALRQCEVLRDELLRLFADDPTLEPRDVLVMTPRVDEHAPLLAGVLARRGLAVGPEPSGAEAGPAERPSAELAHLPAIPTHVADLGLTRTNPMAEALLAMLELGGERLTATRVAALWSLAPVRERFEIAESELGALEALVAESGLRWGVDATDRGQAGQPPRDQNTLRFAAERVALGVVMPDAGAPAVIATEGGDLGPAVPLEIEGRDATASAGKLLALLRAVAALRPSLAGPHPLAEWRRRLVHALDTLAAPRPSLAWQRADVVGELDTMVEHGRALGAVGVERAALLRALAGRFELRQRGDRPLTGAVTVCALQPMRSVPFRVIALLGMNTRDFPRGTPPPAWSPFAEPRAGEHDARSTDRHLLLEALLSARERLLVLWSGRDERQGTARAAAVPVEELLETLGALTGSPRGALVVEHPLQPWSEGSFTEPARSHDAALAAAARARRERDRAGESPAPAGLLRCRRELLPEEEQPLRVLRVHDLVNALYRPQRLFLRDRLGVQLEHRDVTLEDREPLDWTARSLGNELAERVVQRARAGLGVGAAGEARAWQARLAGEGALPVSARCRGHLDRHVAVAAALLAEARGEGPASDLPQDLEWTSAGGLRLVGRLADVRVVGDARCAQWLSAWRESDYARLDAYTHLLVARACGRDVAAARIVAVAGDQSRRVKVTTIRLVPADEADPRAALEGLLALVARARRTPLPLFAKSSRAVAETLRQWRCPAPGSDPSSATAPPLELGPERRAQLAASASGAWRGGPNADSSGDLASPWVAALFGDWTPAEHLDWEPGGFLDLAWRVWGRPCTGVVK
ncbi:MAG: exodeoxyribonuclease V subunit gamma [Polyangiaceae bacterium]|nr:exodeoxyribonuclease V subunit gamma [Polyangiaceae bacterium]